MAKTETGYILTARNEGKWRWATVPGVRTDRTAIVHAKQIIADKRAQDPDPDDIEFDHEGLDIWLNGGITLSNPKGRIVWTSPMKLGLVS